MSEVPVRAAHEREQLVVQMYDEGQKLSTIEEATGFPRSTIYYVLKKHGRTANRANQRARLLEGATADTLLELINHQHQRILELEAQVRDLGGTV